MELGDKVWAKNPNITLGYAGKKGDRKYNPWVDTTSNRSFWAYLIPGVGQVIALADYATGYKEYDSSPIGQELQFLADSDPDPETPINKFIGGSTNPPQRAIMVEFKKGDEIGVYTGVTKYAGGVEYVQVVTELRGYTGSGNDFPVAGKVWFRADDVSNNLKAIGVKSSTSLTGNSDTGTGNGNGNSNNTIWYVVGAILLSLVGFFIWKSNKK